MRKLGIVGNGFLAGIVAGAWRDELLPGYELVGILGRTREKTGKLARDVGTTPCGTLDELLTLGPEVVVECASVQAVRDYAIPILTTGSRLVALSIGAFADGDFYRAVSEAAREHGGKVHLASGAIGGFDVLRTVSLMGRAAGTMETRKGPRSLENTPVYTPDMAQAERVAFSGTPAQAIGLLPTKVNVSVAAALATVGPEEMGFSITSVPGFVGDDHRITVERPGVRAVVDVYSDTSAIAGWSVVALLRNLNDPIQFF